MWTLPVCTCMAGVTGTLRLGPPLWATLMCPLGTRVHFPSQSRDPVGSTGPVVVTGHTDPQKQMRLGAPRGGFLHCTPTHCSSVCTPEGVVRCGGSGLDNCILDQTHAQWGKPVTKPFETGGSAVQKVPQREPASPVHCSCYAHSKLGHPYPNLTSTKRPTNPQLKPDYTPTDSFCQVEWSWFNGPVVEP